jgi:basic membrane protein A and related proteins
MVSDMTKSQANLIFQKIKDGELDIFRGPIKDNLGKLKIPSGKTADNHCIEHMNWVVTGVEGYSGK